MPRQVWTAEDDSYIQTHYPSDGAAVVAATLGRSINSIRERAYRLGVRRDIWRPWTDEREQYILEHCDTDSDKQIADALDISPSVLKTKMAEMRAKGRIGTRPLGRKPIVEWTDELASHIVRRYPKVTNSELAAELDVSIGWLYVKLAKLKAEGRIGAKPRQQIKSHVLEQAQLAYLAGIFDAGASFQIRKRAGNYAVRLSVTMPAPTVAELFGRTLGGTLEVVRPDERRHGRLAWYAREGIHALLVRLQPYAKHEKFNAMLDFLDCPCDEHMQAIMQRSDPWIDAA